MKDWWQKLTIDWPCALGDWLWLYLVEYPRRSLARVTHRRLLHFIGLIVLLLLLQQVVLLDLTFLFGLDLGMLMEISAAMFVLSAYDRLVAVSAAVKAIAKKAMPALRRGHEREIVTRAAHALLPPKNEDGEPAFA